MDESHRVYSEQGLAAYSKYQIDHEEEPLAPGEAFPLVKKLLALNNRLNVSAVSKLFYFEIAQTLAYASLIQLSIMVSTLLAPHFAAASDPIVIYRLLAVSSFFRLMLKMSGRL